MRISDAAELVGLPASTIRYYERRGLLPGVRRKAGQREFTGPDLQRLAFIQLARQAGFTLTEIRALLSGLHEGKRASPAWRQSAARKRAELADSIARARVMQRVLDRLLGCECPSLEDCADRYLVRLRERRARPQAARALSKHKWGT